MALINSSNFSGGNDGWELNYLSGWIKHATFNVTLWISGSGASATVASFGSLGCYYRTETPASADQRIAADMIFADFGTQAGNSAWVAGRINTAANTMYRAGKVDGYWHIQKVVAGTVTTIGTPVADFVSNTTQRATLEIIDVAGNVELKLYKNAETTPITSGTDSSSPITAVGKVGLLALTGNIKLDNFQADTIETAAASATITGTTTLPAFSGSAQVAPVTSITVTAALPAFSGGASTGSASATVTATTSLPSFSGSATGDTSSGVLTLPVMKNNTGTVLANETGATVHVYAVSTGNKVVTKTGQTTNASGVMTVTDALIVAGTQYRVVVVLGSGAEGLDKVTAS